LQLASLLYDTVDENVTYDKPPGTGYGRGDVDWVCDHKFGNCTDFHSLFISLARSKNLPAKFEMGFGIPTASPEGRIEGYHCWAFFFVDGHGWVPVDISEADKAPAKRNYYFGHLNEDRVAFSQGRDLILEPKQAGEPVNFLIYPYAEVDGKPHEKMEKKFSYQNL
jgi:transglutaminase-like putative cysteine protease